MDYRCLVVFVLTLAQIYLHWISLVAFEACQGCFPNHSYSSFGVSVRKLYMQSKTAITRKPLCNQWVWLPVIFLYLVILFWLFRSLLAGKVTHHLQMAQWRWAYPGAHHLQSGLLQVQ